MNKPNVSQIVEAKLLPIIAQMGYELVDVEYSKKGEDMSLTIFVDVPTGITLDDCESIHRAVDPILDELNPTEDKPYVLNVSSPGLDRPFSKQRDYERNYGREVEVKLYAPLKGKKLFEGILKDKSEHVLVIMAGDEEIKLESSKVALVRPLVKFD